MSANTPFLHSFTGFCHESERKRNCFHQEIHGGLRGEEEELQEEFISTRREAHCRSKVNKKPQVSSFPFLLSCSQRAPACVHTREAFTKTPCCCSDHGACEVCAAAAAGCVCAGRLHARLSAFQRGRWRPVDGAELAGLPHRKRSNPPTGRPHQALQISAVPRADGQKFRCSSAAETGQEKK